MRFSDSLSGVMVGNRCALGAAVLVAGSMLATTGAWAQGSVGYIEAAKTTCVNESNAQSNNCTANDLTFVQLGLGTQRDGCVNHLDRVKIFLRGAVQNTTAQARYDVGLWFPRPDDGPPDPNQPGVIDPEGDGALSGDCYLAGLMNPEYVPPTDACTWDEISPGVFGELDLGSGGGPWVNSDGTGNYDSCGDVFSASASTVCDDDGDGTWDDSIILIDLDPQGIEIDCNDDDGTGVLDGFVNLPVCLTWGNQQGQVDNDGNGLCDAMSELQPGTKSKCRCEQYQPTDIPAPDLSVGCPTNVTRVGQVVTGQFSYENACTCTPVNNESIVEHRFECCTASFVEFILSYDTNEGSVTDAYLSGSTFGEVDYTTTAGQIVWRPGSRASGDGIIPQAGTDTLTVEFTLSGSSLTPFSVTTNWANEISGGALVSPVSQTALSGSCAINTFSTWANVSGLTADVREGRTVVSWETSAEVGTVGYDVYRRAVRGGEWVKVNDTLLPALGDGPGGDYQVVDERAPADGAAAYKVVEVDSRGRTLETRPVDVMLRETGLASPLDDFSRKQRQPSRRMVQAVTRTKAGPAKTAAVVQRPSNGRVAAEKPSVAKIGVAETGLYRVSTVQIAVALDENVATTAKRIEQHKLALTAGGSPVAWMAEPNAKGILFFGEAPDSLFDTERFYMLQIGQGQAIEEAGQNPPQPDTAPGTFSESVSFDNDVLLRPFNVFEEDADFWFWDAVMTDDPTLGERHLEIELEGVAASTGSARMKVGYAGFAPGPAVSAALYVNDHYVGGLNGSIVSGNETAVGFNQAYLKEGVNDIKIVGLHGGMLIDRIEVSYERSLSTSRGELIVRAPDDDVVSVRGFTSTDVDVFDISDPLRPVQLPVSTAGYGGGLGIAVTFEQTTDDGDYLVLDGEAIRTPASIRGRPKANLRGILGGADYLIITTADLASTAERLAAHRQQNGLKAMVFDVEDIFNEFAFGARDPGAINAFLAYAADHWATPPRYLLLAGRGHYDPKDILGYGGDLLPPLLAATENGLVPSDNRLVDLDGNGLPDLAVGRLPVLDAAELNLAIDKIIKYENAPTGDWAKQVMLVADDPDEAGDFVKSADALALALPSDREVEKVYLFNPYPADEVNARLTGALGSGVGIVNWTGHAGLDSLANEKVLTIDDLDGLGGTFHPPVMVGLTCLINNFGFPYFATLGEELSLVSKKGAVAVWAASGLSNNTQAERLGEEFMAALGGPGPHRLGDLILNAINEFAGSRSGTSLGNEYVLFGDPALELK